MDSNNKIEILDKLLKLSADIEKAQTVAKEFENNYLELPQETEEDRKYICFRHWHYRVIFDILTEYINTAKETTKEITERMHKE